jgi:carbamoyl-phosphate synthase large subunit
VNPQDRPDAPALARLFQKAGFKILATNRTCAAIDAAGLEVQRVNKNYEGRPNILDLITNGEIDLIVNTPVDKQGHHDDSYLRKASIKSRIPYITTMTAAFAAAEGICKVRKEGLGEIRSLQDWHKEIMEKS